jgi:hypothetical protein
MSRCLALGQGILLGCCNNVTNVTPLNMVCNNVT